MKNTDQQLKTEFAIAEHAVCLAYHHTVYSVKISEFKNIK